MLYSQAAELPVILDLGGGEKITFPLLDIGDYDGWIAELHTQRKQKSLKLIDAKTPDFDKFRMARMAEFDEPTLDTVAALVYTAKGARRILDLSLAKGGVGEVDRATILKRVAPRNVVAIAVDVSGLFEKKVPDKDPNDQKGEADKKGDAEEKDPAATGS